MHAFIYSAKVKRVKREKKQHSLLAFHLIGLRVVPVETLDQHIPLLIREVSQAPHSLYLLAALHLATGWDLNWS